MLHYPDKAALLQAMTAAARFGEMLRMRWVESPLCAGGLKLLGLGVCEYLAKALGCPNRASKTPLKRSDPIIEGMLRNSADNLEFAPGVDADLFALTVAWAIFGAASRWAQTPDRRPAEQMADTIEALVRLTMKSVLSVRGDNGRA